MEANRLSKQRVYVAGDAIYSSLGYNTQQNIDAVLSYRSGIDIIDDKSLYAKPFYGSRTKEEANDVSTSLELEKYTILEKRAIYSIKEAIKCSNIDQEKLFFEEVILILSTTKGNIDRLINRDSGIDEAVYLSNLADNLSKHFSIINKPLVISNACISGVNAVITASRLIEDRQYKHAIIVGADLLSGFVVSGFQAFHSISTHRCKPYDLSRDGLSLGEAVGVIILTADKEKALDIDPIVVEAGAISNDANHLSAPSRTGDGLGNAILQAMSCAQVKAEEIDFINAHGTATVYNDEMESKAVHWAGLQDCDVQSLKPNWGHTLGASGVIESIACFWQLKNNKILATLGFNELGVPMEIKVNSRHREKELRRCLKTASGFGGCNASVLYALDSFSKTSKTVSKQDWEYVGKFELSGDKDYHSIIREYNKEINNKDLKFFKMDDLTKLGSTGALFLLKDNTWIEDIPKDKRGLFFANFSSSLNSDVLHQQTIEKEGDQIVSPAVFVYTLPNIVLGEISIRNKFMGENTFFIFPKCFKDKAVSELLNLAKQTNLEIVIVGWCEQYLENFELKMELYKRKLYES